MQTELFKDLGVQVDILEEGNFLKIKETLTRMGVQSRTSNTLFQSCHILHKRDRNTGKSNYAIMHFKELFHLDGKTTDISEEDILRRNKIVKLLEEWGLLVSNVEDLNTIEINKLKIISFQEKKNWDLRQKYTIGNKGKKYENF